MAFFEILKNGKLIKRLAVSDERARRGCSIQLATGEKLRLQIGETREAEGYRVRLVDGEMSLADQGGPEAILDASAPRGERSPPRGGGGGSGGPSGSALLRVATGDGGIPRIEGYEIKGKLGEGGMGTVWRAVQVSARREVALKLMSARAIGSEKARQRFEREVELSGRLEHPGVARLYESGLYRGIYYYAMELVQGVHLDRHVVENKLDHRQILELMAGVCRAVEHAHQKGVIHRDLKPSNILVSPDGKAHVLDFGLAKTFQDEDKGLTVSIEGDVAGTPAYMSPEQAAGKLSELDTRTDVYSLGVVLYRLLTGENPHDLSGGRFAVVKRIVEEDVRPPRSRSQSINRELESLLLKALARESDERYPNAGALAQDIENYLNGEPLNAQPATTTYFLRKRIRKYRVQVGITAGVAMVLLAVAVLAYVRIMVEKSRAEQARAELQAQQAALVAAKNAAENNAEQATQANYVNAIALADAQIRDNNVSDARRILLETPARLRGWEWRHLWLASDTSRRTFHRQEQGIDSVAYSPDGKRVASAGPDWMVQLWDTESGKQLLAIRGDPNDNLVPRLDAGQPKTPDRMLWGMQGPVSLVFSPDGNRLASGGPKFRLVRLWDAESGKELPPLRGNTSLSCSLAFSPDGKHLAEGSWNQIVTIWDTHTGNQFLTLRGSPGPVSAVAFSPDGKRLACANFDKTVRLWDAESGKELLTLHGHTDLVGSVAFSPDGKRLASGSWDKTIRLWDAESGKELLTLRSENGGVHSVAFSPDGKRLAAGSLDCTIKFWDIESGKQLFTLRGHEGAVFSVAFSPDGKHLVSGSSDGTVKLWDTESDGELLTLRGHLQSEDEFLVACSPDARCVVAASRNGTLQLWDTESGNQLSTLRGHTDLVNSAVFSLDGKYLASGSADKTLRIWNTESGKELLTLRGDNSVTCVAFSPDGKRLASGNKDNAVQLWDAQSGKKLLTISGPPYTATVAFSPSGSRLISRSAGGTITIWDAQSGKELLTLLKHDHDYLLSVAINPGETCLALGTDNGTIKVLDAKSGKELLAFGRHNNYMSSVVFSPDGKRLASGSGDKTVKLWDAESGKELLNLRDDDGSELGPAAFSPDGNRLISRSVDGTIRIWGAASDSKLP